VRHVFKNETLFGMLLSNARFQLSMESPLRRSKKKCQAFVIVNHSRDLGIIEMLEARPA
jgi:hypothetical protein